MNEFDVLLARKLGGSSGDTYTKAQIDAMMAGKVSFTDIDSTLSTNSENPVQNKVITGALGGITITENYIELANGQRVYFSSTAPTGTIPEDSIGIGF